MWVFVWGIEDLDLCFCFCFCCCFCYSWRGRQLARERKKAFFIPIRMNSSFLNWTSYCSSASEFLPNEEADAVCFAELFVIFLSFQPNREADENALMVLFESCKFTSYNTKLSFGKLEELFNGN